jgi:hypothetical protein
MIIDWMSVFFGPVRSVCGERGERDPPQALESWQIKGIAD